MRRSAKKLSYKGRILWLIFLVLHGFFRLSSMSDGFEFATNHSRFFYPFEVHFYYSIQQLQNNVATFVTGPVLTSAIWTTWIGPWFQFLWQQRNLCSHSWFVSCWYETHEFNFDDDEILFKGQVTQELQERNPRHPRMLWLTWQLDQPSKIKVSAIHAHKHEKRAPMNFI